MQLNKNCSLALLVAFVAIILAEKVESKAHCVEDTTTTTTKTAPKNTGIVPPNFKYVCKSECGQYAQESATEEFLAARCCVFVPCPGSFDSNYSSFREEACATQSSDGDWWRILSCEDIFQTDRNPIINQITWLQIPTTVQWIAPRVFALWLDLSIAKIK